MGISNNDYNWRLVAAEAIPENTCVIINSAGKAAKASGTTQPAAGVVGICPQAIASGERCPVIRGGTISGLVGFSAGQKLRMQTADGTLGTATGNPVIAVVKSEDATTAVILTGALDALVGP